MAHWSDGYIDIPHDSEDCGQLVERALREQHGKNVRFPQRQRDDLFHRAALIKQHAAEFAYPIPAPVDGCGVLMLARGRMAHIGLYCEIDFQGYVLHSDSLFGTSTRMPISRMVPPFYRIQGFYGWL